MIRSFLAIELHEPLRQRLAQLQAELKQRLSKDLPRNARLTWVRPASLHLTVKFLGDIDEQLVAPLRQTIETIVCGHRAIEIPLERLGSFPRPQQPRVLWIGPSDRWETGPDAERVRSLHGAVEDCCATLNLAPDSRPLSPHLTLARIKEGERWVGQALASSGVMDRPLDIGSLSVSAIALIKSDLTPRGSVYTRLWDVQLSGETAPHA